MLWHWFGAMVWRNVRRTMLIDIAVMWPGVYARTRLTLACSQRKKSAGMSHAYIHTLLSFHTPSCFVTHPLSHSTLSHTTVLTSRSFTTSFVFPPFPVPATTFEAHYWKKLTCGVIRSFNFFEHLSKCRSRMQRKWIKHAGKRSDGETGSSYWSKIPIRQKNSRW